MSIAEHRAHSDGMPICKFLSRVECSKPLYDRKEAIEICRHSSHKSLAMLKVVKLGTERTRAVVEDV